MQIAKFGVCFLLIIRVILSESGSVGIVGMHHRIGIFSAPTPFAPAALSYKEKPLIIMLYNIILLKYLPKMAFFY